MPHVSTLRAVGGRDRFDGGRLVVARWALLLSAKAAANQRVQTVSWLRKQPRITAFETGIYKQLDGN